MRNDVHSLDRNPYPIVNNEDKFLEENIDQIFDTTYYIRYVQYVFNYTPVCNLLLMN